MIKKYGIPKCFKVHLWFTISKWLVCKPILSSYIIHPGLCKNVLGRNGSECTRLKKPGLRIQISSAMLAWQARGYGVVCWNHKSKTSPELALLIGSKYLQSHIWVRKSVKGVQWLEQFLVVCRTANYDSVPGNWTILLSVFKGPTHKEKTCSSP